MGNDERRRLQALYRRAVVLRDRLLWPAEGQCGDAQRYDALRRDLAGAGIPLASGMPVIAGPRGNYLDLQMIPALETAMATIERRLSPGPHGAAAVLVGAFWR